jgi:membrane protein implicated in regulation of membrane protease activity
MQSPNLIRWFQTLLNFENHESVDSQDTDNLAFVFVTKYFKELAIVDSVICPHKIGRIRFRGTWWNAICHTDITLPPGTSVRVIGRAGITFFVEPSLPINE